MNRLEPAERCSGITPFLVMEVLEKIQKMESAGKDVVHLEIGEPDFPVPECVLRETVDALGRHETGYTHSLGDLRLRRAISRWHRDKYKTDIDPDRILVTSGTSPAMLLFFSAFVEPGDEIIISDPHYACYPNFIKFARGVPVTVPVSEEEGFQYTTAGIKKKITEKTKGIFINSPSNPTGNVMSGERMKKIAELCDAKGITPISDEIYHGLVYEGEEHSILEFTDNAFVFNGFSKLFAMTGLRLGYIIAPEQHIRTLQILHQNFFICANSLAQSCGARALSESAAETLKMKETYTRRRKFMIKRLREMGLGITVEPTGAFYVFANAKHISGDSFALALDILEKQHVGVTPGIGFGENGEGYLRFSYANSLENIEKGMDRLEPYFSRRP